VNQLLNFDVSAVDWLGVQADLRSALTKVAAGTPTPIDDLAIPYLADALEAFIRSRLPQPAHFAATGEGITAEDVIDLANKAGVKLNPLVLSILLTLAKPVIEALIARWARK
jgi:hypothetical protein